MILLDFIKKNKIETIVFIIFCFLTIFISFFHEPWFDEFQSWGIAKDSLYNILFVIPHFEGHPPVWHLILKFFQQFTTNPELVVKIPNLLIMYCAIGLLLFKSPFPKAVKLSLPFTYFLFYQYTIISRPYSILILGLFMAAAFYKERDEKPFRFMTALIILSTSSLYGMILTALICIEWGLSILFVQKQKIKDFFTKDKRFFAMLCLLFLCAAFFDVRDNYGAGREISKFLNENHLTDKKIMCSIGTFDYSYLGTVINPYFDRNIFMNYNTFHPEKLYLTHNGSSEEYILNLLKKWEEMGAPDIVINEDYLSNTKSNYFKMMYLVEDFLPQDLPLKM